MAKWDVTTAEGREALERFLGRTTCMEVRTLTKDRLTHDRLLGVQDLADAVIRQAYEDARDVNEHENVLQWLNTRWFEWWCDVAGIDSVRARRMIGEAASHTARRVGATASWVRNKLAHGPVPVAEVEGRARSEIGIDKRTLRAAARKLGVRKVKVDGVWMWKLPNDERGDANEVGTCSA